ncbi:MAG: hypothetical protein A2W11_08210 [Ignavibacteria bacterium RBG_16_35_7]|nr:MAG: hypothetical protein A2W11_08210 [Ignavibacteria bacterium RBG_16_35_7]
MKTIKYFASILFLAFISEIYSQVPDTLWTKTIGGINRENGYSVKQTDDSGLIIAGMTDSFGAGDYDVYLVRTDQHGDTLWTKTYGGTDRDFATDVLQTEDGGYIVIGATKSYNNGVDDLYLIRTDDEGDTLWTKVYGGSWGEVGSSIVQDDNGNYVATGYTMSFDPGNADVWIIKFTGLGDTLWTKRVGGSQVEYGLSIIRSNSDGYIVTGYTESFGNNYDVYLIRLDANGDTLWTKNYGGQGFDSGNDLIEADDGEIIIAGYTTSYGMGEYDFYLVGVNVNGDTLWTKHYGGEFDDKAYAIEKYDDGFAVAGFTHNAGITERDALIIKTNFNGDSLWTKTIGGSYNDWIFNIDKTDDNGLILIGGFDKYGDGNNDVWLVRVNNLVAGLENELLPTQYILFQNYPNPFNPTTSIQYAVGSRQFVSLKVYDVLGSEVTTLVNEEKQPGVYEVEFDGEGFASGIYFYKLQTENYTSTKKMIYLK